MSNPPSGRRHAATCAALFLLLAGTAALAPIPRARAAPAAVLPPALVRALARRDPAVLADTRLPRLAALDSLRRARLLDALAGWPLDRRVAALAFLQVGAPYRLGPLGEGAAPDLDPVLTLDASDCTALVLTSTALAHARDAGGERAAMAVANYRGGAIGYATRFHFTTDRLDSCAYFRDLTRDAARGACRADEVRLNLRADGSRWIPIEWTRTRTVTWVPRDSLARFGAWFDAGRLPEAAGVAFVDTSTFADGLDVVHESLLWKGRTILHASSRTGRVVALPWMDYLRGPGRGFAGCVLFGWR